MKTVIGSTQNSYITVNQADKYKCYIAKTAEDFDDIYILSKLDGEMYCWSSLKITCCWANGSFDSFSRALGAALTNGWEVVECSTREDVLKFLHK